MCHTGRYRFREQLNGWSRRGERGAFSQFRGYRWVGRHRCFGVVCTRGPTLWVAFSTGGKAVYVPWREGQDHSYVV